MADIVGDSLQLAREASLVDGEIIIQCGVHFMAETSKLLNPDKTVLIPEHEGRMLAVGIDHRRRCGGSLKERYPGVPVVDLCQHVPPM